MALRTVPCSPESAVAASSISPGNGLAGLPLAMLQAVQHQPLDLLVQRAEGRRDCCRAATCGGRAFGAGRKQDDMVVLAVPVGEGVSSR